MSFTRKTVDSLYDYLRRISHDLYTLRYVAIPQLRADYISNQREKASLEVGGERDAQKSSNNAHPTGIDDLIAKLESKANLIQRRLYADEDEINRFYVACDKEDARAEKRFWADREAEANARREAVKDRHYDPLYLCYDPDAPTHTNRIRGHITLPLTPYM